MKYSMVILFTLVLAGSLFAGCTSPAVTPVVTTAPPTVATTASPTPSPQPSFSLGYHYLEESYSFQSETEVITRQFRVDNPSWAIEFDVLPLNDNLQYCWFEINVTNLDTGHMETYGYGRENGYELRHLIPMYNTGPYQIEMRGNRVKVDVTAAKRNP
jgi:hypothetical protein